MSRVLGGSWGVGVFLWVRFPCTISTLPSKLPTPNSKPEALNRSTSHRCFCAGVPHSEENATL